MCGIAGLMALGGGGSADLAATALAMANTLAHRGPDGADAWADAEAGIGLGHRRLAIIDLSPTGAQPMHSADGRYVIVFNGEIYNFQELRTELETRGHRFRGSSDTEVMLAACVEWGPEEATKRFLGMFAFALFDRQTRTLRLVRDRLGVKPLYWCVAGNTLLFGSELRALMAHPSFRKDVDREAIAAVVRYSYVPAPATVFDGVFKLEPGSILTARAGAEPIITPYWRLLDTISGAIPANPPTFEEATERLEALLRDGIRRRLVADVPVGAFLSGGIDSSAVVALMQAVSGTPVRTFTVGFGGGVHDETEHARAVAHHLRTDHTEIELAPDAAGDLVTQVPDWFDEPFADGSQLPTYLVARTTRQHVKVALSGDGGDELFAGYPKYPMFARMWGLFGHLPHPMRTRIAGLIERTPEPLGQLAGMFIDGSRAERIGEKLRRLGGALKMRSADEAALVLASVSVEHGLVAGASGTMRLRALEGLDGKVRDLVSRMQIHDTLMYLPDDILTKVDRCTMAVSLEAREPLLDHRLVEFVWSLPASVRRGDGRTKALLRAVLDRHVPRALTDRPKRGFQVPLGPWLKGPLRDWAENLLDPAKLAADGLFDAPRVRAMWQRHLTGQQENAAGLWNVLMVRAWSERWLRA